MYSDYPSLRHSLRKIKNIKELKQAIRDEEIREEKRKV